VFSSRRRHTRSKRDWSSDVCSSDLRLNEKSGMFKNMGEHQVKELIKASKLAIFFIDENQKIHIDDIGNFEVINRYAKELNSGVTTLELTSQFRCNGSDGYLAWVDDVLQIRETANVNF